MGKKIIIGLLGILAILLIACTVLFYTDQRYSYSLRTYRTLSDAESLKISYESHIGLGENQLGIHGTAAMTFSPKASFIEVYTELPIIGDRKILDIYTENREVYHKFNVGFLPWRKGVPLLSEDAFNPTSLTEITPNGKILPLVKFLASLKKVKDQETLTYYTTDFFTEEEFKTLLSDTLKLESLDIKELDITSYKISAVFSKTQKFLKEIRIEFTNKTRGTDVNNAFSLEILSVNTVDVIEKPMDLPED